MKLRFLRPAIDDISGITAYLERSTGDRVTARRFAKRLQSECRRMAALPGTLGTARPELGEEIRMFAVGNYLIFFRYQHATFDVLRIVEGHRDLGGQTFSS